MENEQNKFLGEAKIGKLMLEFSIPCVLSLLISALYNIVDQIFVGNSELSVLGNAATGVVFPIFIIAQAFAWCLGDGCAAYLNLCQGRRDTSKAHKAIGTGIVITIAASAVLMAVFFPLKRGLFPDFKTFSKALQLGVSSFITQMTIVIISLVCNIMLAKYGAKSAYNHSAHSFRNRGNLVGGTRCRRYSNGGNRRAYNRLFR